MSNDPSSGFRVQGSGPGSGFIRRGFKAHRGFRISGFGFQDYRAVGETDEKSPLHTKSGVSNTLSDSKTKTPWYKRMVKLKLPGTKAFYRADATLISHNASIK